jgi:hypothetical protein
VAGAQVNEVKSAWKKAQQAWVRVEASLASLVESDKVLIQKLRKAGKAVAKEARVEARSVVRELDRKRKSALKRFEKVAGQHKTLRRPAA